jgi:hypothetical protein
MDYGEIKALLYYHCTLRYSLHYMIEIIQTNYVWFPPIIRLHF